MSDTEAPKDVHVEEPIKPVKPKRQLSAKQLENLAKARTKANEALKVKRERNAALKKSEKKLKELKMKEREERVQAELNAMTKTVNVEGKEEKEPVQYVRKPRKTKKPPKIVYYSSSSEESSPEIVYKKKPKELPTKPRKEKRPPKYPKQAKFDDQEEEKLDHAVHDAAVEQEYQRKLLQIRKQYLMQQVFPS